MTDARNDPTIPEAGGAESTEDAPDVDRPPMFAAIVLAGGEAQRLGGTDKPGLAVRGAPMLHRVLSAVRDADPLVVVGPPRDGLPARIQVVRESPPGGGPVAAAAAGLAAVVRSSTGREWSARDRDRGIPQADLLPPTSMVALLAADLPFLTADALRLLRIQLESRDPDGPGSLDGAVFVDDTGRRQLLCGVWRIRTLLRAVAAAGDPAGRSIWQLVGGLRVAETLWRGTDRNAMPPWFDCDTEADLRLAEEWTG